MTGKAGTVYDARHANCLTLALRLVPDFPYQETCYGCCETFYCRGCHADHQCVPAPAPESAP